MWLEYTGAGYQLRENPTYYAKLLSQNIIESSPLIKQIDRDLHRTFANESCHLQTKMPSLRNILIAYATRNPSVGYCQGLNFIVGRLISLGFSEEESFWMLCHIVEIYLPIDYFSQMIGVLVDQKVFESLLVKYLPGIAALFRDFDVDVSFFSVHWFICIFAYSFHRDVSIRLWDCFFVKGNKILFSIGLAVLYLRRKQLLTCKEFDQVLTVIDSGAKSLNDPQSLLSIVFKKFKMKWGVVKSLRETYREEVELLMDSRLRHMVPARIIMRTISHFCDTEDECQQKIRRTSSYHTFSTSVVFFIRDNYLDDESIPKHFNTAQLREVQDKLLVGVKNHVCSYESSHIAKPNLEEFIQDNRSEAYRHPVGRSLSLSGTLH